MAKVTEVHRILAHQVFILGELHGQAELKTAIAQAIADAEERGPQTEETNNYGSDMHFIRKHW